MMAQVVWQYRDLLLANDNPVVLRIATAPSIVLRCWRSAQCSVPSVPGSTQNSK